MAKKPKSAEPQTQEPIYTPPANSPSQGIVERFESPAPESPAPVPQSAPDLSSEPQYVHPILVPVLVAHEARKHAETYAKETFTEADARLVASHVLDKTRVLATLLYASLGEHKPGTQFIFEYRDPKGEAIT